MTAKTITLKGIKILDFSRILAAPLASMILSDLGAEVWKVERPGSGDELRQWTDPSINGQSCYYIAINRNKKSVALNLGHPEGQALARRLSTKADVLLENFKTGLMDKFGLDYHSLSRENPRLIYCSITGYGPTGPYANDPGYDVVTEAIGGLLGITGPKGIGHEPCKPGVAVVDIMTGLYAHGAILAALLQREQTGHGQQIHCNLLSTQITALVNVASNYLNAGLEGRPLGTEHESAVPYQAFRTRDGRYYVVGATNSETFRELCNLMDLKELPDSDEFRTINDRVRNRVKLVELLSKRFALEGLDYWKRKLRNKKFPSGPINTIKEAFEHEQVKHLGIVQEVAHPNYGKVRVTGPPVSFSGSENKIYSAPPLLGEHTREVLSEELGLSSEELEKLKRNKAIDF